MRAILVGVALALMLVSCSTKRTVVTSQGTMTVETNPMHNTVKVSNARGTAIIGRGAVSAKSLALPVYPTVIASLTGASAVHNASGISEQVSLITNDSFEQVYSWYKQRMPNGSEQTHTVITGGSVASFEEGKLGDKDQKSVIITQSGGKTTILLTHIMKNS